MPKVEEELIQFTFTKRELIPIMFGILFVEAYQHDDPARTIVNQFMLRKAISNDLFNSDEIQTLSNKFHKYLDLIT